jgi:hypothetical protein
MTNAEGKPSKECLSFEVRRSCLPRSGAGTAVFDIRYFFAEGSCLVPPMPG